MRVEKLPDLPTWLLLDAVDRLGSVGAAARRAGFSQQAASARVRAAERVLGVALFARSPRGTRTTEQGRAVLDAAAPYLDAARSLAEAVGAVGAGAAARLRVAVSNTVAEHYLPSWLQTVLGGHPGARVDVHAVNSREVLRQVREGLAELGFVESPATLDAVDPAGPDPDRGLLFRTVARDAVVLAAPAGHPWARAGQVSRAELARTGVLVREEGSGTRVAVERALPELAEPAGELGSLSALISTSRATGIPAFVPRRAVAAPLREIRVPGVAVVRPIRAVVRPGAVHPLAAALVRAAVEDGTGDGAAGEGVADGTPGEASPRVQPRARSRTASR
ncbi:LysR family transcriptional regulator [Rothia kristinae]|uniref:LysR family transcriptional regulator n=2 Tax=Rothia kristinae TaxID=37923 RepID=A0A199NV18_9MICC|nr:LysR family transcriptional regulator [Rothia kristinae]TDP51916.1 LysR family transcriptional regulator [Kocuria sp. AG109]SIM51702.1 LysR family transcriptional regulator [Mycobacteroides abscessus subsp. abscessus]MCA1169154.1 LysR family transcriptional regulator [Rothia kristinae]MCT1357961.1 LysR family transcriptional regulator [Rothia kristinae]MCT1393860.1 LysR family transcriptional regulator [Rothia kristinae]